MDAPPAGATAKRRKLRIFLAAILVLIFFGSLGYVLIRRPQLPVTVISIVVAGAAAAVFAAYFIPNKLSERAKRAVAVGVPTVSLITSLLAPVLTTAAILVKRSNRHRPHRPPVGARQSHSRLIFA